LNNFHTFSQIHFFHLLLKSHGLCQSYLNTNISTETNKQTNKKVSKSMKHFVDCVLCLRDWISFYLKMKEQIPNMWTFSNSICH
jgi:hypothetical protein